MEIATSSSRTSQMRSTRAERTEKEDRGKTQSTHKSTRYKEKYQVMRERFDKVNETKETYLRELELATEKIQKIQEENDLLLDAVLANPPPCLNPYLTTNSRPYPSSLPPPPPVPSQNYAPGERTSYQSGLGHPPPTSIYQHPARPEHQDHGPPPPPSQHSYSYPHQQPPRQFQYPSYNPNDARDSSSHHYSTSGGRGRGLPSEAVHRA